MDGSSAVGDFEVVKAYRKLVSATLEVCSWMIMLCFSSRLFGK